MLKRRWLWMLALANVLTALAAAIACSLLFFPASNVRQGGTVSWGPLDLPFDDGILWPTSQAASAPAREP